MMARDGEPDIPQLPPEEAIPARMINEFVYCPRLFYYEYVEGVFRHNADTLHGAAIHERVDSGDGAMPPASKSTARRGRGKGFTETRSVEPEIIHSRSVALGSNRLGVTAKLDLVEIRDDGDTAQQPLTGIPVDYKAGRPRETEDGTLTLWDADKAQLGLQILLLRENGYRCNEGIIYYRQTKQRVRLEMTPDLERWLHEILASARICAAGPIPLPLVDSPKCPRCSLVSICLPDETQRLRENSPPPDTPPVSEDLETVRRLIAPRDDARAVYVNGHGGSVGKDGLTLEVRERDGKSQKVTGKIPLTDVSHVAVFGSSQVTTGLLQTLCEREIPISYFSSGGWFYGITRGHDLTNVFTRIRQFAVAGDEFESLKICRAMISGKIWNQRTLLMRNHLEPPSPVLARLKQASRHDCMAAKSRAALLGIEGAAAALYFEHFAGMLKTGDDATTSAYDAIFGEGPDRPENDQRSDVPENAPPLRFDFRFRNRRPPKDPVNAMLSLAYSLLTKDCTIAATAVGFDPYLGFFHQPRYGRPALALDIMEEFRALIADSTVITVVNNQILKPRDFIRAGDSVTLSRKARGSFIEAYERRINGLITHPLFGYQVSYRRAIELQFRLLARVLTAEVSVYRPFITR
jgi:CRISPR-associated protein Cas1